MTISTFVTVDGRSYEVVTDETQRDAPFCVYCQVYRIRADGTRGRFLHRTQKAAWAAYRLARTQLDATA